MLGRRVDQPRAGRHLYKVPKHGETQQLGMQRTDAPATSFTGPDGAPVWTGAGSSFTQTVSRTYCGHCREWIQTNGVMGPLAFMAKHDSADCTRS